VALALLRVEHAEAQQRGEVKLEINSIIDNAEGGEKRSWEVRSWWPDWWPQRPPVGK